MRKSESMDKRADAVFQFLVKYFKENGYAPTYNDIKKGTGIGSGATIGRCMTYLAIQGRIEIGDYYPHGLRLVGYKFTEDSPE